MKKLLIVSLLFFIGCGVNSSHISTDNAQEYVESMTYVKDKRTNLCFGVFGERESGKLVDTGINITNVPCENVRHFLK